jgi:hypothetical protein
MRSPNNGELSFPATVPGSPCFMQVGLKSQGDPGTAGFGSGQAGLLNAEMTKASFYIKLNTSNIWRSQPDI